MVPTAGFEPATTGYRTRPEGSGGSLQSRAFGHSEQPALNRESPGLSYVGSALPRLYLSI